MLKIMHVFLMLPALQPQTIITIIFRIMILTRDVNYEIVDYGVMIF